MGGNPKFALSICLGYFWDSFPFGGFIGAVIAYGLYILFWQSNLLGLLQIGAE